MASAVRWPCGQRANLLLLACVLLAWVAPILAQSSLSSSPSPSASPGSPESATPSPSLSGDSALPSLAPSASVSSPSPTSSPDVRVRNYDWALLDAWLQNTSIAYSSSNLNVPAYASMGLIVGNLSGVLYTHAVGNFDLTAPIFVGTASQWVSASIIAEALREVGSWLGAKIPNFVSVPRNLPLFDATFRQLLSHTSGLAPSVPCTEQPLSLSMLTQTDVNGALVNATTCVASAIASSSFSSPPPGSQFNFAGSGMQIAAAAAYSAYTGVYNIPFTCVLRGQMHEPSDCSAP